MKVFKPESGRLARSGQAHRTSVNLVALALMSLSAAACTGSSRPATAALAGDASAGSASRGAAKPAALDPEILGALPEPTHPIAPSAPSDQPPKPAASPTAGEPGPAPAPAATAPVASVAPASPEAPLGLVSGPEACASAFVRGFKVASEKAKDSASADYCSAPLGKLPAAAERVIRALGALHHKTARFLGVSAPKLFGAGISVEFMRADVGVLASFYDGRSKVLHLGVFAGWDGGAFNEGVYVHELGHALADSDSAAIPPILHELSRTNLIVEAFADFVSLGTNGKVFSDSVELPGCLGRTRVVGKYNTYDYPGDFFRSLYSTRKLVSCCNYLKERSLIDAQLRPLCDKFDVDSSVLPPLDRRTPFDAQDYFANAGDYDAHQIGIPLNGFLRAVAKDIGTDALKLFFDALWKVSGDMERLRKPFTCAIAKMSFIAPVRVQASSMEPVLLAFRDSVPVAQRARYDELWKQHAMEKAIVIARADSVNMAALMRSETPIVSQLQRLETTQSPELLRNECYLPGGRLLNFDRLDCRPTCR